MAVSSGKVSLSNSTPTLVYQTPDGVVTTLVVQTSPSGNDARFGDSSMVSGTGIELTGDALLTLTNFTGALYGMSESGTTSAQYIAADIQ